jgi:hypothetical protein
MGSPLGPLMANTIMGYLEEKLRDEGKLPEFYKRFVDDTLTIMPSEIAAKDFLSELNGLHSSLSFTAEVEQNNGISFCGAWINTEKRILSTSVFHKPTDTGLLLHFHSHTDVRYKKCLIKSMLYRAYRLSSGWSAFNEEVDHLRTTFQNLAYPSALFDRIVFDFVEKCITRQRNVDESFGDEMVRFTIPYKDEKSARNLKHRLNDLACRIRVPIQPIFTSRKIGESFRPKEAKPKIVSQQCVVYKFQCGQCDAGYIGMTTRHLHQRIEEHRQQSSSIGQHLATHKLPINFDLHACFTTLRRCRSKWECLLIESLIIAHHKFANSLNVQSDSIKLKLF